MKKVLVIAGPTSTGKTDVALSLAKKIKGELVSCDSRQVYKGLDIGTGKAPSGISNIKYQISNGYWTIDGVKVWMYDVADPKNQYSVWEYINQAKKVIRKIISVKRIPIVVGGSGLYLKALMEGLNTTGKNEELRQELENLSVKDVQQKLIGLSPIVWEKLNESERKNKRRLIRKIEIETHRFHAQTALRWSYAHRSPISIGLNDNNSSTTRKAPGDEFDILKIGLCAPRLVLNERIDERVDSRIRDGMIEEAEGLHKNGLSFERMKELGLEYGMLAKLLSAEIRDVREFREILKTKIHQYAKRQMTWFRNQEKDLVWFDITQKDFMQKVERSVSDWYNASA